MELYFDGPRLMEIAAAHKAEYAAATPFPHIALDGIMPEPMLDLVLDEFPPIDSPAWTRYRNYNEGKQESQGEDRLPQDLSFVLYQFNSAPFLRFLEELTGIAGLIGDPYFTGGGLHQIPRDGRLGIHADFSRHYRLPLERRLNVLVYLNKDWKDEYGGHLELWNRDMSECVEKIAPIFNRTVIFSTTDWTYHGHPDPLTCPPGMSRKSIALYYFTVDRPKHETIPGKQTTLFLERPGEHFPADAAGAGDLSLAAVKRRGRKARAREIARRWTPPAIYDAVDRARQGHH